MNILSRQEWITRCKRKDKLKIESARICSDHFTPEDYERDLRNELLQLPTKKILKPHAIPTIFPGRKGVKIRTETSRDLRHQERTRKETVTEILAAKDREYLPSKDDIIQSILSIPAVEFIHSIPNIPTGDILPTPAVLSVPSVQLPIHFIFAQTGESDPLSTAAATQGGQPISYSVKNDTSENVILKSIVEDQRGKLQILNLKLQNYEDRYKRAKQRIKQLKDTLYIRTGINEVKTCQVKTK